jgi:hypothetical protein
MSTSQDSIRRDDPSTSEGTTAQGPAPWLIVLLVAAALAWVLLFTITFQNPFGLYWFSFIVPGWAFVAAGLIAWARRPENRMGRLMTLTGFLLFFPTLSASRVPILYTIGSLLTDAGGPALFYLILSYPRGALFTRPSRVLFWTSVLFAAALDIGLIPWGDPRDFGCVDCPPGLNLLQIERNPELVFSGVRLIALIIIPAMLALAVTVITRWIRATPPSRTLLWPVYLPTALFALFQAYLVVNFNFLHDTFPLFTSALPYIQPAILTLLPLTFLLGLLRMRARRARVGDLAMDLWRRDQS